MQDEIVDIQAGQADHAFQDIALSGYKCDRIGITFCLSLLISLCRDAELSPVGIIESRHVNPIKACFHATVTVRHYHQNLPAAKITPLTPQLENSIRFHAVCSAVTVRYSKVLDTPKKFRKLYFRNKVSEVSKTLFPKLFKSISSHLVEL